MAKQGKAPQEFAAHIKTYCNVNLVSERVCE